MREEGLKGEGVKGVLSGGDWPARPEMALGRTPSAAPCAASDAAVAAACKVCVCVCMCLCV